MISPIFIENKKWNGKLIENWSELQILRSSYFKCFTNYVIKCLKRALAL